MVKTIGTCTFLMAVFKKYYFPHLHLQTNKNNFELPLKIHPISIIKSQSHIVSPSRWETYEGGNTPFLGHYFSNKKALSEK